MTISMRIRMNYNLMNSTLQNGIVNEHCYKYLINILITNNNSDEKY